MQNLHLADQTLVKKPPQRYHQLYRYGASSEPSLRRDTRSQSAPNGYQSAFGVVEQIMSPKNVPEEEAEHVIPANLPVT